MQQIEKHTIKKNVSFCVFLTINLIFSIKYFSRYSDLFLLWTIILSVIQIIIWKKMPIMNLFNKKGYRILDIIVLSLYFIVCIFIFNKVSPETLNVDRWSVITSFWDNYFQDEYVYAARSHQGNLPGPMPFYFILALPFYLLGELGYFSFLGVIVFYLTMCFSEIGFKNRATVLLLILSSSFYIWEIITRSNIFLNSSLILFSLVLFFKIKGYDSLKKQLLFGLLFGLLLSTRNVFIVSYIITFIYLLNKKIISFNVILRIAVFTLLSFSMTFVPFLYNYISKFMEINPFIIQSSALIPFGYSVGIILLSFLIGFLCKKETDVYFYSGIILFLAIIIHVVHAISIFNVYIAYIESAADISYFILCVPFFLYYLVSTNDTAVSDMKEYRV